MMKKRIVMILLVMFMVGCTSKQSEKTPESTPPVLNKDEATPSVVEKEGSTGDASQETEGARDRESYVIQMFEDYGKTVDATHWTLEEQGEHKVAVIIKEYQGHGKPNISKLIFLWYGSSDTADVLFMMVDNMPVLGSE